MIQCL